MDRQTFGAVYSLESLARWEQWRVKTDGGSTTEVRGHILRYYDTGRRNKTLDQRYESSSKWNTQQSDV